MTDHLSEIPYHELERHHEQANIALRDGLERGDSEVYRAGERLEQKCRREKVRRAQQRSGP